MDEGTVQPSRKVFLDMVQTPSLIFRTRYGSLQMTSIDLAEDYKEPIIAQLEASDLLGGSLDNLPLSAILKFPSNQVNIISARNMDPAVTVTATGGISVETPAGRRCITVEHFAARCAMEKPRAIVAMIDEVNFAASNKKTRKAFDTTNRWFDALRSSELIDWSQTLLFAGVVGRSKGREFFLRESITHYLKRGARGIVLSGYGQGESRQAKRELIALVRSSIHSSLTEEEAARVPIMVQGLNDLEQILEAVLLGVDLIGTDLPMLLTNMGYAFGRIDATPALSKGQAEKSEDGEPARKKIKHSADGVVSNEDALFLNLRDRKYARDLRPLMEGCPCHCCRSHSRGYIHHLLLAHELLGEVLINTHNQHNMLRLFAVVRKKIEEGQFDSWSSSLGLISEEDQSAVA